MPWGRVDDNHYDHPKVMALPREIRNTADGLYWRAVSRCNRTLSDGYLTPGDIDILDGSPEVVEALVVVGLFERDRRGQLRIHDFLDHNKSREEVAEDKAKRADAGRAGGLASGRARAKRHRDEKRAAREANRSTGVEAKTNPVPSRPVLDSPTPPSGVNGLKRANGTNPRALGTNPRAVTARDAAAKRDRSNARQRAYLRGEITEEQLAEYRASDTVPPVAGGTA